MNSAELPSDPTPALQMGLIQSLYSDNLNVHPMNAPWVFMDIWTPDGGLIQERLQISRASLHDQRTMWHELIRTHVIDAGEVVVEYLPSFHVKVYGVELDEDREVLTHLFTLVPCL